MPHRPTTISALALLSLMLGSCASPQTSLQLHIVFEQSWSLGQLSVVLTGDPGDAGNSEDAGSLGDAGNAGASERSITMRTDVVDELSVPLPESWANRPVRIRVSGLRSGRSRAEGTIELIPPSGVQTWATLVLMPLPCGAWCREGARRCEGNQPVLCEGGEDGCMGWSPVAECGDDAPFCSHGACRAECVDECRRFDVRCDGPTRRQICDEGDADPCLEWVNVATCTSTQSCSLGRCAFDCEDECEEGETSCVSGAQTECGDFDADRCLEWGPATPCAVGENCALGACMPAEGCADVICDDSGDDCLLDSGICIGDGQCIYPAAGSGSCDDGQECTTHDRCRAGICTGSPIVCDAPDAPECINATTLRSAATAGFCAAGVCSYRYRDTRCAFGCGEGACLGGPCDPETLATRGAWGITLHETHVYWTSGGSVTRARLDGSDPQVLATDQRGLREVALDDTHIYWTNWSGDQVMRARKDGTELEVLASEENGATGIALDDTHVYWTTMYDARLMRARKDGTDVEVLAEGQEGASGIALDDTHVYWTNRFGHTLMRARKDGTAVEVLATEQSGATGIALDEFNVYWTNWFSNQVMRANKDGTGIEIFADEQRGATSIVVSRTHVYWTNLDGGQLMRARMDGAELQILSSPRSPLGLAVDPEYVYWTNLHEDGLTRLRLSCF